MYNDETDVIDTVQLENIIQGQIERIRKDKYFNCGLLKFITNEVSINRTAWLIADYAGFLHRGFGTYIQWVLDNIDIIHDDVFDKIYTSVFDLLARKHNVTRTEVNIAFAIRLISVFQNHKTELLLNDLYQIHENSPFIKLNIIHVFARWQRIDWLKVTVSNSDDLNAWQRRSLLMNLENYDQILSKNKLTPLELLLWS